MGNINVESIVRYVRKEEIVRSVNLGTISIILSVLRKRQEIVRNIVLYVWNRMKDVFAVTMVLCSKIGNAKRPITLKPRTVLVSVLNASTNTNVSPVSQGMMSLKTASAIDPVSTPQLSTVIMV